MFGRIKRWVAGDRVADYYRTRLEEALQENDVLRKEHEKTIELLKADLETTRAQQTKLKDEISKLRNKYSKAVKSKRDDSKK